MTRAMPITQRLLCVYSVIGLLFACPSLAAACATPIVPPQTNARPNWAELERFQAPANLNPLIQEVQALGPRGHGAVNNDFFAITIDKGADSAEAMLSLIRRELSTVIFRGTSYSVEPMDAANGQRWASADARGAVMSFTLAAIPGVMPLERGSVVVSCIAPTSFIFSTVRTERDGWHPVAGNRAFGVRDNGNGSLTIWTKAADRVVNGGIFAALPEALRNQIFLQGEAVWLRLLDNLQERFANRRPRDRTAFSERRPFD